MNWQSIAQKVPMWLISSVVFCFLGVLIEQLYISKRPVNLWGLELNKEPLPQQGLSANVPLGTILAWHKNASTPSLELPNGWEECNGQAIKVQVNGKLDSDGNGIYMVPNLNSNKLNDYLSGYTNGAFLRGSLSSGVHQNATELVNVFGHSDAQYPWVYVAKKYVPEGPAGIDKITARGSTDAHSKGGHGWGQGNEVQTFAARPVNMAVVWVMRVK